MLWNGENGHVFCKLWPHTYYIHFHDLDLPYPTLKEYVAIFAVPTHVVHGMNLSRGVKQPVYAKIAQKWPSTAKVSPDLVCETLKMAHVCTSIAKNPHIRIV